MLGKFKKKKKIKKEKKMVFHLKKKKRVRNQTLGLGPISCGLWGILTKWAWSGPLRKAKSTNIPPEAL